MVNLSPSVVIVSVVHLDPPRLANGLRSLLQRCSGRRIAAFFGLHQVMSHVI